MSWLVVGKFSRHAYFEVVWRFTYIEGFFKWFKFKGLFFMGSLRVKLFVMPSGAMMSLALIEPK